MDWATDKMSGTESNPDELVTGSFMLSHGIFSLSELLKLLQITFVVYLIKDYNVFY